MGDEFETIRIGTRRSALARAQTAIVAAALRAARRDVRIDIVPMASRGDTLRGPLSATGGKGLFCAALEDALRAGHIDLAVHSAKDLPVPLAEGMTLAAVPRRGDPRDALVSPAGGPPRTLRHGARVGTSSVRRAVQLRAMRPDVAIVALRGNVETRMAKVLDARGDERLDAAVLAMAGLERLGLTRQWADVIFPLRPETFVPAAGQGTLAVETLATHALADELGACDDGDARQALTAERGLLERLGADCHSCVGVHVARGGGLWHGQAMATDAGGEPVRVDAACERPDELPGLLAERLARAGASARY
ncbi:MAG: hydroxymethylbilane synthase [Phycisphaerae bacterium]|nr:hydroxymethylbilane synthase [Phycisphaerae bacterium]